MKNRLNTLLLGAGMLAISATSVAQHILYPQHFDLTEVTLNDGPFKTAMNKNIEYLLQYDVDRLLTPFVRQAGLNAGIYAGWEEKHPNFENWGSGNFRLDGHVGGHYLTALALAYAASRDEAARKEIKTRLDYMIRVLDDCQKVFDNDTSGLRGMISGVPDNNIWTDMYSGKMPNFGYTAVPLYTQHKVIAGLRDVYVYTGNETAGKCFFKMADWFVGLFHAFTPEQQQRILDTEHGGVNETIADAYKLGKSATYLEYAKKYSHQSRIDNMQTLNTTYLDNQHANTQVPKYIGFERIAELAHGVKGEEETVQRYSQAAKNFWQDVVENRTVCIGGNSINEHFMAAHAGNKYMTELDGPESCNSNNMLKLSEELFDETHDARYMDFYESTTWNHIMSTQDPVTGGYVYFTPLRPQSYRIYSKPNQDMWCCVGTGMENHSKYGEVIYTSPSPSQGGVTNPTLYINLFVASQLKNKKFALTQETEFPYSNTSTITIDKTGKYTIAVRHPAWAQDGYSVKVNGVDETGSVTTGKASYVTLAERKWKKGDQITISLPMALRYEECPNLSDYIAFKYGPILLGAKTIRTTDNRQRTTDNGQQTTDNGQQTADEELTHEYALGERMGHSPGVYTKRKSINTSPMLIGERSDVLKRITLKDPKALTFMIDVTRNDEASANYPWKGSIEMAPYYSLHHARVNNYFYQATLDDYKKSPMVASEQAAIALQARTISAIATGEQQSEAGVTSYSTDVKGSWKDEYYRSAENHSADAFVQYVLANPNQESKNLSILLRFTLDDRNRKGTVSIDGTKVTDFTISAKMGTEDNGFVNYELNIPENLIRDNAGNVKKSFSVRINGNAETDFPSIYYVRLLR